MKECYFGRLFVYAFLIFGMFAMVLLMHLEIKSAVNSEATKTCQPGFRFSQALDGCVDINECNEHKCDICRQQICQNLLGTYECRQPECPIGYRIHASYKASHVNKCVRKRCKKAAAECLARPKYKTFKAFHVSTDMSAIVDDAIAIHEIFMKRFGDGVRIDVTGDDCVPKDFFVLKHNEKSVTVVMKAPLTVHQLCAAENDKISVDIRVVDKRTEKEFENVKVEMILSRKQVELS